MDHLYAPFVRTNKPIIHMDVKSAELTKYAANAMLATRISFMNEMAQLCERSGCERGPRAQGDRERLPHRLPLPLPGSGLRRQLLPQGPPGV